jgi:transcription elongation factor Elf1
MPELTCTECNSQNVLPIKVRHGEGHRIVAYRCHSCGHKFDVDIDRHLKAMVHNPNE